METANSAPVKLNTRWAALFLAWLISSVATLGALFIGEVLGQEPCLLCWYQRIAMFPLILILGIACYTGDCLVWRYSLPLAGLGVALALWHTLLYYGLIPKEIEPCGRDDACTGSEMTIFGVVPLPLLSLAAFGAISLLLIFTKSRDRT